MFLGPETTSRSEVRLGSLGGKQGQRDRPDELRREREAMKRHPPESQEQRKIGGKRR
jgi:hypothetical protein